MKALITGATGSIGQPAALRLAQQGHSLILVGRDARRLKDCASKIHASAPKVKIDTFQADLSLIREAKRLLKWIHQKHTPLDLVVQAAAVTPTERTVTDEREELVSALQFTVRQYMNPDFPMGKAGKVITLGGGGMVRQPLDWLNLYGEKFYDPVTAQQNVSIANDLATLVYNERFAPVRFYSYGPGCLPPDPIPAPGEGAFLPIDPQQTAADILTLATTDLPGGLYGPHVTPTPPSEFVANPINRRYALSQIGDVAEAAGPYWA